MKVCGFLRLKSPKVLVKFEALLAVGRCRKKKGRRISGEPGKRRKSECIKNKLEPGEEAPEGLTRDRESHPEMTGLSSRMERFVE